MLSQRPKEAAAIYGILSESTNFVVVCRSPSICFIAKKNNQIMHIIVPTMLL
jgi:biotin carboxylase